MADRTASTSDADAPSRLLDDEALFARIKGWYREDWDHHHEWMKGDGQFDGGAEEDFNFVAGHQWSDEELRKLEADGRPASVFNRITPMVDSVVGFEVSNRQEVRFLPRQMGASGINELLTAAGDWFRDQTDGEDEDSDAFRDAVICGKGWTETRIDYETNPDGDPSIERIDPMEIFPDKYARKANLVDARRIWRIRRMTLEEAVSMFPDVDESALSAGWADASATSPGERGQERYENEDIPHIDDNNTIVECQWWELEPFVRYVDGVTGTVEEVPFDDFQLLMDRLGQLSPEQMVLMGIAPPNQMVVQKRRIYRRAYLGSIILGKPELPVEGHFTYKCITGKRDQTKGQFYGLVRPMKDPQRWLNKLFSQIMHIVNSNAKGGILAERGAFEDDREAAANWSRADGIVWMNKGAIAKQQIMPKPVAAFPDGQANMLQFAMGAMPMVTGVNLEMLGMSERQQAGVLEFQRRQSAVTILATLFDSLRRYRKEHGRLMLRLIQKFLSDGRLVKIAGGDYPQFERLDRSKTLGEYEVIVDEAPNSPNAKERNWSIIQSMMPMIGQAMTPQIAAGLLRYSPLPEGVVSQIAESLTRPPPPPPPEAEVLKRIDLAKRLAEVDKDAAAAEKSRADSMARQAATFAELAPFVAMTSPELPQAPVPSGPIPGLDIPVGAATPPPMPSIPTPPSDSGPGMPQPPMAPMPFAVQPGGMAQ